MTILHRSVPIPKRKQVMHHDVELAYQLALTTPIGDPHLDGLYRDQDPQNYLRFLYYICKQRSPKTVIEFGTETGRSACHLAAASGKVYTIDPELHGAFAANTAPYSNIEYIPTRSDDQATLARFSDNSIDVCFVDSLHSWDYCLEEVRLWTPKLVKNGIFLLDDLDMMSPVLDALPFKDKGYLGGLHTCGFGYAII